MVQAVMRMPDYAKKVKDDKSCWHSITLWADKTEPWIYDVTSNEELERLLAMAPFYNYAHAEVLPLAEMETPAFNRLQRKVENAGCSSGFQSSFRLLQIARRGLGSLCCGLSFERVLDCVLNLGERLLRLDQRVQSSQRARVKFDLSVRDSQGIDFAHLPH